MENNFTSEPIERLFKNRFSSATNIHLLWKGNEAFETILDAIKNAEEFICLQFYIFRNDETGTSIAEILKQKSLEGIKVYVLYDNFGSIGTPKSFWDSLKGSGVHVKTSRPFRWNAPCYYAHRDHRKLLIIDGKRAFTGGLNIANEYSGFHIRTKGKNWRDTGIMLEGAIAEELFELFLKSWRIWEGDAFDIEKPEFNISNSAKQISAIPIFVSSARGRRRMRRLLYYSINHARHSISLTTAYFVPSRRMVETLENAVKRGVKVRLLLPGKSDVPAASYAGMAFFTRLLKAGVEIYQYGGEILHAKTHIFDNCWSIVGSTNLDFQSLRYNDEGNVGILDNEFASQIQAVFEEDLKNSIKIELRNWRERPLLEKLKEHFFSLFRRRL
jgi:cardiolipin synthase